MTGGLHNILASLHNDAPSSDAGRVQNPSAPPPPPRPRAPCPPLLPAAHSHVKQPTRTRQMDALTRRMCQVIQQAAEAAPQYTLALLLSIPGQAASRQAGQLLGVHARAAARCPHATLHSVPDGALSAMLSSRKPSPRARCRPSGKPLPCAETAGLCAVHPAMVCAAPAEGCASMQLQWQRTLPPDSGCAAQVWRSCAGPPWHRRQLQRLLTCMLRKPSRSWPGSCRRLLPQTAPCCTKGPQHDPAVQ